jgi:MSHA biogenesis protein MshI
MFSRLRTTLLPGWIGCAPSGAQSSLALVQRPADGPPVVRWLASADWTRPTETLRQLKRGRELHRHRRVALLQNAQYQCVSLDAPTDLPREEWSAAVRWQLKDSVDFPVDTAAVDLLTVAEGTSYRTQPQLIVVAAPAESVRPLMQQGLQAKTPWDAIDIAETARRRCCTARPITPPWWSLTRASCCLHGAWTCRWNSWRTPTTSPAPRPTTMRCCSCSARWTASSARSAK